MTIWSSASSPAMRSRPAATATGSGSTAASTRTAPRIWDMRAAASTPLPMTSPMTSARRSPGTGMASYQSPPTRRPAAPGAYRAAIAMPGTAGSRCGSSPRWSTSAVRT